MVGVRGWGSGRLRPPLTLAPRLESQLLPPELSSSLSIRQDGGVTWVPGGSWGWGRTAQSRASSCPAHTVRSTTKVGAASPMSAQGVSSPTRRRPGILAKLHKTEHGYLFFCFNLNYLFLIGGQLLCWFLPGINMTQLWAHACPLPIPPPGCQSTGFELPGPQSKFPLAV